MMIMIMTKMMRRGRRMMITPTITVIINSGGHVDDDDVKILKIKKLTHHLQKRLGYGRGCLAIKHLNFTFAVRPSPKTLHLVPMPGVSMDPCCLTLNFPLKISKF